MEESNSCWPCYHEHYTSKLTDTAAVHPLCDATTYRSRFSIHKEDNTTEMQCLERLPLATSKLLKQLFRSSMISPHAAYCLRLVQTADNPENIFSSLVKPLQARDFNLFLRRIQVFCEDNTYLLSFLEGTPLPNSTYNFS